MNGLDQYQRIFQHSQRPRKSLDRGSLPAPLQYLSDQGIRTDRKRGQWVTITCPVHKSGAEDHPSMRVSVADGHFRCMACGAKGGDVIAFHRLITGLGFVEAVADLGGRFHD